MFLPPRASKKTKKWVLFSFEWPIALGRGKVPPSPLCALCNLREERMQQESGSISRGIDFERERELINDP